jgi:Ca2+-binding EF-hand superfamily protein
MRRWFLLSLLLLCPAIAAQMKAQGKDAPTTAGKPKGPEHTYRGNCSEAQSRDLFTACDADGDDRLDLFEAHDALDTMRSLRDADGFAVLDKDRNGYVSWPEFDANLRSSLLHDGKFTVRTSRRLAPSAPEAKAATPLQQFLQLHDTDGNGGLDPAEIEAYLRQTGLPPALGGQLRTLDLDRSGRLEEAELAPWFEQLPGRSASPGTATDSVLLPLWASVDDDNSGTIDVAELARVLRRLDPTLERAAAELLRSLDKNRDGVLQPGEIPAAVPSKGPGRASTAALESSRRALLLPGPSGSEAAWPLPVADVVR